jgi:hypothetical protein
MDKRRKEYIDLLYRIADNLKKMAHKEADPMLHERAFEFEDKAREYEDGRL